MNVLVQYKLFIISIENYFFRYEIGKIWTRSIHEIESLPIPNNDTRTKGFNHPRNKAKTTYCSCIVGLWKKNKK